jgi:hypothetical protein
VRRTLIALLLLQAPAVLAADSFDSDCYHDRQDACRELQAAQLACVTGGLAGCEQGLIDRLQRQCSAFGPLRSGAPKAWQSSAK